MYICKNNKQLDSHNQISFRNLSQDAANKQPLSPYAEFAGLMVGWLVFHKKTHRRVFIWELWALFQGDQPTLKAITDRTHNSWIFIRKEDWDNRLKQLNQ